MHGWVSFWGGGGPLENAALAVDLFFVLSGFILFSKYWGEISDLGSLRRFLVFRVARIYPLHAVTLVVVVAIFGLSVIKGGELFNELRTPDSLVYEALLIHGIGVTPNTSWNAPSWSISAEYVTYFIFGLVCMLAAVHKFAIWLGVGLFIYSGFMLFQNGTLLDAHAYALARCIYSFFIGIMCAVVTKRKGVGHFSISSVTFLEAAVVVACFCAIASSDRGVSTLLLPWIFAVSVIVFSADRGLLSRLLASTPFKKGGELSYSIYMWHIPVLFVIQAVLSILGLGNCFDQMDRGWERLFAILFFLAATITVANLSYIFIEVPARNGVKVWYKRKYGASSAMATAAVGGKEGLR